MSMYVAASPTPPTGNLANNPGTALDGDPLIRRTALNPLSHTSQGIFLCPFRIHFVHFQGTHVTDYCFSTFKS